MVRWQPRKLLESCWTEAERITSSIGNSVHKGKLTPFVHSKLSSHAHKCPLKLSSRSHKFTTLSFPHTPTSSVCDWCPQSQVSSNSSHTHWSSDSVRRKDHCPILSLQNLLIHSRLELSPSFGRSKANRSRRLEAITIF